jgi:cytidylate kinase
MTRRVVCISRLVGAGGEAVGQMVADSLGYRLVDEEILQQAAESSGVSVDELADAERRTKVIEGLLKNLTIAGGAASVMAPGGSAAVDLGVGVGTDSKSLRALIQKSIHETAAQGDVVIVSHAASYALAGDDDVLRVLVTASPETRTARAAQAAALDDKKAAKVVADSDAARAAYLKRFYGVGDELSTHYDLALNSDSLSIELMSDIVIRAATAD